MLWQEGNGNTFSIEVFVVCRQLGPEAADSGAVPALGDGVSRLRIEHLSQAGRPLPSWLLVMSTEIEVREPEDPGFSIRAERRSSIRAVFNASSCIPFWRDRALSDSGRRQSVPSACPEARSHPNQCNLADWLRFLSSG